MTRRSMIWLAVVPVLFSPAPSAAQPLVTQHDPIGCIVAGKYPKFTACFDPVAQLAAGRVYFRPEGISDWYYVELVSDMPCHATALPKPSKELVGQKIEYYVQSTDKNFVENQTETYAPIVVAREADCKDLPVAPYAASGPAAVFPSLPAGFAAGGLGGGVIVGGVLAGGAIAGGAAALGGDDTTTTSFAGGATTTQPAATTTTQPSPTTTLATNRPPTAVFRVTPDPPRINSGEEVTFNMCPSSDPDGDRLFFRFDYGDGATDNDPGTSCRTTHTYTTASSGVSAQGIFNATTCVTDNNFPEQCQTFRVDVSGDPCLVDDVPPNVTLSVRGGGYYYYGVRPAAPPFENFPIGFSVIADDRSGVSTVEYFVSEIYPNVSPAQKIGASSRPSDFPFLWQENDASRQFRCGYGDRDFEATAQATDRCGNQGSSAPVQFSAFISCFYGNLQATGAATARVSWQTALDVTGGHGQVVLNGRDVYFPRAGRSMGVGPARVGENRIEATLVEASGEPGTWRFEFGAETAFEPGSLRVIAGEVTGITNDAVTFRLSGRPGERVVFSFRAKR